MIMSNSTRTLQKLIKYFDDVSIPDGKELVGCYTAHGSFTVRFEDSAKEVDIKFGPRDVLTMDIIHHDKSFSVVVPKDATDFDLKDLVGLLIRNHL